VSPHAAPVAPAPALLSTAAGTIGAKAPNEIQPFAPPSEPVAPRPERLARGLASFSRDNADRERKFRHILSDDEEGGAAKKP